MPKIKWIGFIKEEDIKNYQKGELSSNAKKLNTPPTMTQMMIKGLPFAIPGFLIGYISSALKYQDIYMYRKFIIIGALLGLLLGIVHELLHAIVYPKKATVYIGMKKNLSAAFALSSYPMKRRRFILMCLLPYILGIIPLCLFWVIPVNNPPSIIHSILFGLTMVGLLAPYPDLFNVYQVLKKTPKNCKVQFYEDDIYYTEK